MANLPIQDFPDGGSLLSTDLFLIARPTDATPNKNYKVAGSALVSELPNSFIKYVQNLGTASTLIPAVATRYFLNSNSDFTVNLPVNTGGTTIAVGDYIELYIMNGNTGSVINAPAGGMLLYQGIPYSSFNPKSLEGADGRIKIELTHYNANVWHFHYPLPFEGSLNGVLI